MRRLRFRIVLIVAVALLALGAESLASAIEGPDLYVVREGDTLSAIAQRFGVPLDQLVSANGLANPDLIRIGQQLRLAPPPPPAEYVVQPGDTLGAIAKAHGLTAAALAAANGLTDPDRLVVGQKLVIPGQEATAAAASSAAGNPPKDGWPREVAEVLERQAEKHGVDPALLKALAWQTSGWRADALGADGAAGLLQVTPGTYEWVEQRLLKRPLDRQSIEGNVEAGAAYLAYLIERMGDERTGLAAYFQGPASVRTRGILPRTERALEQIAAARARFAQPATPPPPPLEAIVVEAIAQAGGADVRVGVAGVNLGTGDRVEIRAGERFPTASVAKVPIMVELWRQVQAGQLKMTDALRADLEKMITLSDNDAANRLLDRVGMKAINETMAGLGLKNTVVRSHFNVVRPGDSGINESTPGDMARLLAELAAGRVVSESASQEMRELMTHTRDATKLRAGVPEGVVVAHKSGWYNGVANDVGLVNAPRTTYVLAVFTEGPVDAETLNGVIAAVSRAVYAAWGG